MERRTKKPGCLIPTVCVCIISLICAAAIPKWWSWFAVIAEVALVTAITIVIWRKIQKKQAQSATIPEPVASSNEIAAPNIGSGQFDNANKGGRSASPASAPAAPPAGRVVLSKLDAKKAKEILALSDFCVIDTETTGLSASDKIIEISILRVSGGAIVDEYSTFVNPERAISPQAAAINHITETMLTGAPKYPDVAPRVAALLDGSTVLGHNVSFDLGFIVRLLEASGLSASITWLDTAEFARAAVPGLENYKLQTLLAHFGIDSGRAHRAVDDTRATLEMFEFCRAEYPKTQKRLADERKKAKEAENRERMEKYGASPLVDKRFCFAGGFEMSRKELEALPATVGAICTKGVSGKTDFLVRGELPGSSYNAEYDQYRINDAQRRIDDGGKIRIITESEFLEMIVEARKVLNQ